MFLFSAAFPTFTPLELSVFFLFFFFVSLSLPSLPYVRSGSHPLAKDATRLSLDCASAKLCLARTSSSWHRNHYHSFPPPRGKSETKMKSKKKTRTRSLLLVSLSLSRHLSVSSSYRSLPGTGEGERKTKNGNARRETPSTEV